MFVNPFLTPNVTTLRERIININAMGCLIKIDKEPSPRIKDCPSEASNWRPSMKVIISGARGKSNFLKMYPTIPKTNIILTSNRLLLRANVPTTHNAATTGYNSSRYSRYKGDITQAEISDKKNKNIAQKHGK